MKQHEIEQLDEVFAFPVGLKPVINIDGEYLYGSDNLNKKYIKAIEKSSARMYTKMFSALVDRKVIIPCFLSKGIFGFITWKIFAPAGIKNIMGFYEPEKTNKVYILVSNNANLFAHINNEFMATLTIHELMHRLARNKPAKFMSLFNSDLETFYEALWRDLFSVDSKVNIKSDVSKMVKYLMNKMESASMGIGTTDLLVYQKALEDTFAPVTTMPEEEFKRKVTDYVVICKIYLKDINLFFRAQDDYRHILIPIYNAYREAFNEKNLQTVCIQELLFPSEVIAIYSEFGPKGKIAGALKSS